MERTSGFVSDAWVYTGSNAAVAGPFGSAPPLRVAVGQTVTRNGGRSGKLHLVGHQRISRLQRLLPELRRTRQQRERHVLG